MNRDISRPWLRCLRVQGDDVEQAQVEFSPGFTLIHGLSDTGKTYLADAIDYIFTAASKPFDEETGYSDVIATFQTPQGRLSVNRPIIGSKAIISADDWAIPSGSYSITSSESSTEMSLSDVLLRQMGITEPRRILTSSYQAHGRLTVRRFAEVFYLSENRIFTKNSILQPGSTDTATALALLLFDTRFEKYREKEDMTDQQKRQAHMQKYIGAKVDTNRKAISRQAETLKRFEGRDMEAEYAKSQETLRATTSAINQLTVQIRELGSKEYRLNRKLQELHQTLKNYRVLEDRYLARIKRLGLIAETQAIHEHDVPLEACPFCQGQLPEERLADYKQAIQGETNETISQLKGLQEAITDLNTNIAGDENELESLGRQKADIQKQIDTDYRPAQNAALKVIGEYPEYKHAQATKEAYEEADYTLTNDLHEITHELPSHGDFKARDLYPAAFFSAMSQYCTEILTYCGYPEVSRIDFNREDFDLRVDGKKKRSHGKGYRAFFNTVVLMALRKYIHEKGVHKPFLCVIDTPTLGLDSKPINAGLVTKRNEQGRPIDGLQARLFQYFIDSQKDGQLIVVDNTKDTPAINYTQPGVREYVFTATTEKLEIHEAEHQQYGFLPSLTPDEEKAEDENDETKTKLQASMETPNRPRNETR